MYLFYRERKAAGGTDRSLFQRYGVLCMQQIMAGSHTIRTELEDIDIKGKLKNLHEWLDDQEALKRRREDWSLVMEIAITLLVGAELTISIINFCKGH